MIAFKFVDPGQPVEDRMDRKALKVNGARKDEIEALRFLHSTTAGGISPFVGADCSVGMEYELQVAVEGKSEKVDLPLVISASNYYTNIVKRAGRGDLSPGCVAALDAFLHENHEQVWENSWIRLSRSCLTPWTRDLLARDLLADKKDPSRGQRSDIKRFSCVHQGEEMLRLPVSYLLKLSLANVASGQDMPVGAVQATAEKLLDHLVSDNTSPEILSFTIPRAGKARIGDLAGRETARTFLVCQLLVQYANAAFNLKESGQKCLIYFAPHAPSRQKRLNDIVPDGFYRHLFMSPCLSGWDQGEAKHEYMALCHKTLSRSQLNTISKLKDAGILTNNLITLPNTSNTCLANNGTHVSLGSAMLTDLAVSGKSGFTPAVEKYIGDLVIKIVEHFLPLFVATYSAAPYRIDFRDFHAENVLGFLPHELDYTHLRMVWRRWKKKAKIGFLGRSLTPFGPRWLDSMLATMLQLKGDIVPDFRLIDYLVTLLSTESSPALNGICGNHEDLKEELMEMGVFDNRLSIYLLYRQRLAAVSGYAGFEGRSYSLFSSLLDDMAEAVDIQNLVTALAYRYVLEEKICHGDIPDIPSVESERRQIFFGSAIGIPTFYVRCATSNRFLQKILMHVPTRRKSNRYRGYWRVGNNDYRLALLKVMEEDGADLIGQLRTGDRLDALKRRLEGQSPTAYDAIMKGVQRQLPSRRSVFSVPAEKFNSSAERYFRTELKQMHIREGLSVLADDCRNLEKNTDPEIRQIMAAVGSGGDGTRFIADTAEDIVRETAGVRTLGKILYLALAAIHIESHNGKGGSK